MADTRTVFGRQVPTGTLLPRPTPAQAALYSFVQSHYAPQLRSSAFLKLLGRGFTPPTVNAGGPQTTQVGKPVYTPGLAPPTSAATQNAYSAFPDYAQQSLRQLDADKAAAVQNAQNVGAWLAPALGRLQQGQQAAQSAYGQTIAGLFGGGDNLGAGAIAPSSAGGILAAPSNAAIAGSQAAAPMRAAGVQQGAALQGLLGNLNVGDVAQGALGNVAYQATQIPAQFAAKKNEYLQSLTEAITKAQVEADTTAAKLNEQQREFGVTNATTLRGQDIGLLRTTLGSGGSGTSAGGLKASSSALPLAPGQQPPTGYQTYTDPTSGQNYAIKAPSPASTKPNTGSGGMYIPGAKNQQLVRQGYTPVRVPGGFRYIKPGGGAAGTGTKAYQTLITNWSKEANKRLQGKRVQAGSVSRVGPNGETITTPRYTTAGAQHPEAVFAQMLAAGVKPVDAYRLVNANAPAGVSIDSIDVYNALGPSLGEKRARQVAIQLTGQDPVVAANPGYS